MGATAAWFIPVWPADAMSDRFVKGLNIIEPYDDPDALVAQTRCLPLCFTTVKSFTASQPCAGYAGTPVDVHCWLVPPQRS